MHSCLLIVSLISAHRVIELVLAQNNGRLHV
eukprot:COSAG02_NODE_52402_length_308_cov_0.669856_1_plen_30_part_10